MKALQERSAAVKYIMQNYGKSLIQTNHESMELVF